MTKAVAYMRYSSDNQSETSIEYQRAAIAAYCARHDIVFAAEYKDEAYSATTDRRPDFQRLMKDAQKQPEWSKVLVYDMSRFCRNAADAGWYENLLRDNDIELISVTQQFDTDTIEGFFSKGVTNLINQTHSMTTGKNAHAGLMVKANKAGHCGGIPPLGYDVDKATGHLVINEDEVEIVQMIFDMFEMEYSYTRMAQILNDAGYRTKAGNRFNKNSFDALLKHEKYTGVFTWNQSRQKNSAGRRNSHAQKATEKQVRIENGCPVIITKEQFQRVQETLRNRAGGRAGSKRRYHYMLSGLKIMKCAKCGSYMVGTARKSHGKTYTTYSCPKRKSKECDTKEIRAEYVDKFVVRQIYLDLLHRDDHDAITRQMKCSGDIRRLQDKKRGVERAIAGVMKAMETSCSETLVKRLDQLEEERASLDSAIARIKLDNIGLTDENKKSLCRKFAHYLLESDDPEAKKYLVETVKEIQITNTEIAVEMKIA